MKKIVAIVLLTLCGFAIAQSGTSPNLVYSTSNPYQGPAGSVSPGTWSGFTTSTTTGGGFVGGNTPAYNTSTDTFYFGYTLSTIAYTYAFSQALQNSGMSILGYNYGWSYLNEAPYDGTLTANVNFSSVGGTSLHNKAWTLGPTSGWQIISGTETFTNGLLASNISNFSLSFTGKDSRFWAGYYGPQVKNPSISLNYTIDVCQSNPLSSPSCPGYAAAYLTQQCTANPLFDPSCPGYAAAYLTQQCTANPLFDPSCPGYAVAYLNYQCSINPLYNTSCAGYDQAYFTQQCNLNGLYSKECPNYAEAYAKKMLLEQQGIAGTVATAGVIAQTAPKEATTSINSDGTVSTTVSKTGDSNVEKVISTPTTSTNSAAAPAAPIQLAPQPQNPAGPQQQAEKRSEGGTERQNANAEKQGGQQPQQAKSDDKQQPTARQQLAERRAEAAKKEAVDKGKNLANEMGKVADMEAQKAVQNVVIAAMGYTPGFDAYGRLLVPDAVGYKPYTVYNNQKTVDNARLGRGLFGPTDRLHNDMVAQQYR